MAKERNTNMRTTKTRTAVALLAMTFSITGCSAFERIRGYTDSEYSVEVETKSSLLEDNAFYVAKNDGTYHKLYFGEASFERGQKSSEPDSKRVLWFGKDYDRIPTMYRGEKVAYRSMEEFDDRFAVERFEDTGYTIGICGMTESTTGRYKFSTDPDQMQIDIDASTGILYQLGEHVVTMDRIGDVDLRRGNVSRAGTVVGLERGKTYDTEVYVGTDIIRYSFVADVRAFVSFETEEISDYTYTQGNTVLLEFPDWFQSGYYCVNAFGIVRYVAENREYSDSMDMSIPNDPLVMAGESKDEAEEELAEAITFRTEKEEPVTVRVTFEHIEGDADGYGSIPDPTARVVGDSAVYSLSPGETGELIADINLPAGDYRLEIMGLAGRAYNYTISKKGEN